MGKFAANFFLALGEVINTLVQLHKLAINSKNMNPGEVSPVFNTRPDSSIIGESK